MNKQIKVNHNLILMSMTTSYIYPLYMPKHLIVPRSTSSGTLIIWG